jgi:hypothetical protein
MANRTPSYERAPYRDSPALLISLVSLDHWGTRRASVGLLLLMTKDHDENTLCLRVHGTIGCALFAANLYFAEPPLGAGNMH